MSEIWKTISVSYYYKSDKINTIWEVSNLGNLKRNGVLIEPKPLNVNPNYLVCSRGLVHRLVAKAFIPNPGNKPCIDHIDGNTRNNNVSNLRWVTYKENNNNPITRKHNSIARKKYYETHEAPFKGHHHTEESKQKNREKHIGIPRKTPIWNKGLKNCYSEETKRKQAESCKITKSKWSEEYKKEVYSKVAAAQMGNTAVKGYIHINNGQQSKMIKKEDLDKYIELGYKKGRLLKHNS